MRVAFHVQVLQTPTRWRGMGRYTFNLLREFMRLRPDHEYILIANKCLDPVSPSDLDALPSKVVYLPFGGQPEANRILLAQFINTSGVELYLECSPFESEIFDAVVPNVTGLVRARTCAILYDVIPAIFPDCYLADVNSRETYARKLSLLTGSDFLLSISDWSRLDLVRHFGVSPRVIGNIGGGVDAYFYDDGKGTKLPSAVSPSVEKLLGENCIFYLGGGDWRKNECALIDAYALLPESLRSKHRLVFAHTTTPAHWKRFADHAEKRGVGDRLVHTGYIEDNDLKLLYEKCALFVFPSLYEGFGLPIAEAMVCGAPVLASGTSSMPEVCGQAAILIENPADPREIAQKIEHILSDEILRQDLRQRSHARREHFRWSHVAARMNRHLDRWMGRCVGSDSSCSVHDTAGYPKYPIAIFTPLPPVASGISDYIADLLPHLRQHFDIDLFIDDGYTPTESDPRLAGCRIFNHRRFPEIAESRNYHVINHQLGSSEFHIFQLEWILKYPSVVMLHDPTLAGLTWVNEARTPGRYPELHPELLLRQEVGEHRADQVLQDLRSGRYGIETLVEKGIFINGFVFRYADAVMMQTTTAVSHFANTPSSVDSATIHYAPQPIPMPNDEGVDASAFRRRFLIPDDAILVSAFGIMHRVKQPLPLLEACRRARLQGRNVHLAFVGSDEHAPEVKRRVEELSLHDWVHFCGHVPMEMFYEGLHASDIVACLRHPCQEQLSASLLRSMSCGKAVLASSVPSNRQLPDDSFCAIAAVSDPVNELEAAIVRLIDHPNERHKMGVAAREHIRTHHDPELTVKAYSDAFCSVDVPVMIRERSQILSAVASMGEPLNSDSARRIAQAFKCGLDVSNLSNDTTARL